MKNCDSVACLVASYAPVINEIVLKLKVPDCKPVVYQLIKRLNPNL